MTDSEKLDKLLETVNQMQDHFNKIDNRLALIEHKQDRTAKKLDNLRLDAADAERDIRRDIFELKDEMETADSSAIFLPVY